MYQLSQYTNQIWISRVGGIHRVASLHRLLSHFRTKVIWGFTLACSSGSHLYWKIILHLTTTSFHTLESFANAAMNITFSFPLYRFLNTPLFVFLARRFAHFFCVSQMKDQKREGTLFQMKEVIVVVEGSKDHLKQSVPHDGITRGKGGMDSWSPEQVKPSKLELLAWYLYELCSYLITPCTSNWRYS